MPAQPFYVPIRAGRVAAALRLFRTVAGERTAVAFSSPALLTKVLGSEQSWIRLSEPALRRMLDGLDIAGIVIDPAGCERMVGSGWVPGTWAPSTMTRPPIGAAT
ncbi:SAV_915 family protein [Spongiactinospora gelatinilytica]|uniref:SAV_915 family protein n=1 Tax=Spongiactinospora gelatinilytica TaxID=2666298 RepID=UPI000DA8BFD0|nr:SAV_915 family protein [Spongiactinospora gelatinilytica]